MRELAFRTPIQLAPLCLPIFGYTNGSPEGPPPLDPDLETMASPRQALQGKESSATHLARELEELNRIGIALAETRDIEQLLPLILRKAREIAGADAGSLYLVEQDRSALTGPRRSGDQRQARCLRLRLMQNDSVGVCFAEHTLPLRENSIAGYCALRGEVIELADAYQLPAGLPYPFNSMFDEQSGYRTRSLVALPMKNGKGEVLGVLQLINCKRNLRARLLTEADMAKSVQPFPPRSVRLGLSLASQAAVAYENSKLYGELANLFDGFVSAAVKAVEQRDPATSGHSQRVCHMTLALADAVDRVTHGPYADLHFSPAQRNELRYAALLHDFGKVGVREDVLVKAKKLYPLHFARVMDRFDYIRKEAEVRYLRQTLEVILSLPQNRAQGKMDEIDEQGARLFDELERCVELIRKANEPTVLPSAEIAALREIARRTYLDPGGVEHPYLTAEEVRFLSIPRGTLDQTERLQIESHVMHSFNFLMRIPWTQELRRIPEIVRAHHEKLNGKGYPAGLTAGEIPVQAKIMTVCDIFDALSASDRPYKRAVPAERALEILQLCAREKEIDRELYRLFVEAKIYQRAAEPA